MLICKAFESHATFFRPDELVSTVLLKDADEQPFFQAVLVMNEFLKWSIFQLQKTAFRLFVRGILLLPFVSIAEHLGFTLSRDGVLTQWGGVKGYCYTINGRVI